MCVCVVWEAQYSRLLFSYHRATEKETAPDTTKRKELSRVVHLCWLDQLTERLDQLT